MPKLFAATIALFLLLGAGYGAIQAARSIPWDCADWQAFAHEDRTTAILETLAENRGKTLYCGIDQSDTFTKAETWQAGRDRNERDDTVYWGEGGSFRGFIAAQEGWLTEGESGITGQSIATIFEFPREKKKRRRWVTVTRRLVVAHGDAPRMRSPYPTQAHAAAANFQQAQERARVIFEHSTHGVSGYRTSDNPNDAATFLTRAQTAAPTYCTNAGYERAVEIAISANTWEYTGDENSHPSGVNVRARKSRTWTATCEKEVRRRK